VSQDVDNHPAPRGDPPCAARSAGTPTAAWWTAGRPLRATPSGAAGPARSADVVAYLRFASVYRAFESLADFEAEITALRASTPAEHETGPPGQRVATR
jgi:hypothetical protein